MRIGLSLAGAIAVAASVAFAAPPNLTEQYTSNAFWFDHWGDLSNATMKVTAPNGTIDEIFVSSGTPVYKLGAEVVDGIYRYELTAATSETQKIVNPVDNGRGEQARNETSVPFQMEGSFVVSRGVIIVPDETKEDGGSDDG